MVDARVALRNSLGEMRAGVYGCYGVCRAYI
ncbi:hypothetical protein ABID23_000959 [Bartonella silvatica]|uniref:Uncharacterized protein n=1 Tax=Bartonella silvatica TaxID=357760 RepID=A0ABV2HH34_9HYPH